MKNAISSESKATVAPIFATVALALCPITSMEEPQRRAEIFDFEMPQIAPDLSKPTKSTGDQVKPISAIGLYHELKDAFEISHTILGAWLGVKRRSLHNWRKDPNSAVKYGEQIEYRLDALNKLKCDMEREHLPLLHKIAFSPIYGDPEFGKSILNGESSEFLLAWYDKLFPQFESYQQSLKRTSDLA